MFPRVVVGLIPQKALNGVRVEWFVASALPHRPDRADVIVPAAMIFRKLSKWGRIPNFIAPRIGLADGLAIEMYKKHKREQMKNIQ